MCPENQMLSTLGQRASYFPDPRGAWASANAQWKEMAMSFGDNRDRFEGWVTCLCLSSKEMKRKSSKMEEKIQKKRKPRKSFPSHLISTPTVNSNLIRQWGYSWYIFILSQQKRMGMWRKFGILQNSIKIAFHTIYHFPHNSSLPSSLLASLPTHYTSFLPTHDLKISEKFYIPKYTKNIQKIWWGFR